MKMLVGIHSKQACGNNQVFFQKILFFLRIHVYNFFNCSTRKNKKTKISKFI